MGPGWAIEFTAQSIGDHFVGVAADDPLVDVKRRFSSTPVASNFCDRTGYELFMVSNAVSKHLPASWQTSE